MGTYQDFSALNVRVGKIIKVEEFPEAIKPAYKLIIDFGEYGIKKSSAQITDNYEIKDLINRLIIGIINFPPKQIAHFMSECLILGCDDEKGSITLLQPSSIVPVGSKVH